MKNNKMISGLMVLSLVVAGFLFSGTGDVKADYISSRVYACHRTALKNAGYSAQALRRAGYGRSTGYVGGCVANFSGGVLTGFTSKK